VTKLVVMSKKGIEPKKRTKRTRKVKSEFEPKNLKSYGVGEGKVQKTLTIRQETHHALAKKAHELNLFESDVAEVALCLLLELPPPPLREKSLVIENMGDRRKNPKPAGSNNLPPELVETITP
jgi:hypothetical protein